MKITTIAAPTQIDAFLMEDMNFSKNGNDYFKSYAVTDFESDWNEEVYISLTRHGYEVWYPDNEKKNKLYKTDRGLISYIQKNHS